jgi:O-antigen ligase
MSWEIVCLIGIVGLVVVHPFVVTRFKTSFLLYFFLLPVLFSLFLEVYVRVTYVVEADIPAYIRFIKDIAWVYIFISFLFWVMLARIKVALPREVCVPLLLFLGYMLLQFVRSSREIGLFTSVLAMRNTLGYIPIAFIVPQIMRSRRDFAKVVKYFSLIMLASAAFAVIVGVLGLESRYSILARRENIRNLVMSFWGDYNAFALICVVVFALTVFNIKILPNRGLHFLALVSATIFTILSQSRGGLVAWLFVSAVALIYADRQVKGWLCVVLLTICLLLLFYPEIIQMHRVRAGLFMDARLDSWKALYSFVQEKPVLGYGAGTFGFASLRAQTMGISDMFKIGMPIGVDNFYLTLLLNTGLVGVGLFAFLVLNIFVFSFKLIRRYRDKAFRAAVISITAAISVFLITGVVYNYLEGYGGANYFWFFVGLLLAASRYDDSPQEWKRECCSTCNIYNDLAHKFANIRPRDKS